MRAYMYKTLDKCEHFIKNTNTDTGFGTVLQDSGCSITVTVTAYMLGISHADSTSVWRSPSQREHGWGRQTPMAKNKAREHQNVRI